MSNPPKIFLSGEFTSSHVNSPVDSRIRCKTLQDLYDMENPVLGMSVYVIDEQEFYTIKSLRAKNISGILIENAAVDQIERNGFTLGDGLEKDSLGNVTIKLSDDPSSLLTCDDEGLKLTNAFSDKLDNIPDNINDILDNKVDKVEGKGLSTNDFTNALKNKLESLTGSGISSGTSGSNIESYETHLDFPAVGDASKIYIDCDENAIYRYNEADLHYYCVGRDYEEVGFINGNIFDDNEDWSTDPYNREVIYSAENVVFNGTNYVETDIPILDGRDFTIKMTFQGSNANLNQLDTHMLLHCMYEVRPWPGMAIQISNNNPAKYQINLWKSSYVFSNMLYNNTEVHTVEINKEGSVFTVYLDSQIIYSGIPTDYQILPNESLVLGAHKDSNGDYGRYWNGTIHSIVITRNTLK